MHKNPTNARFIITAPACSMKPSSKYITFAFKLNFHNVNPYSKKSSYYLGVNVFGLSQLTSLSFMLSIYLMVGKILLLIQVFIYQLCMQRYLIKNYQRFLTNWSTFALREETINLCVDDDRAKWAKERRSGFLVFTQSNLKKAIKYFLQNCYFKLQKRIGHCNSNGLQDCIIFC